jgi:hypothetical protein
MDATKSSSSKSIGFVAVRHHESLGYFGGYLVVNELARPLEFHCTLPVQPTRAQSILFGNTLSEFFAGEQIARAMLAKAKSQPMLILTDNAASLAVRHWIDSPVLYVQGSSRDARATDSLTIPQASRAESEFESRSHFGLAFQVIRQFRHDLNLLAQIESENGPLIDLLEPFERIVEALGEAHPGSRAA